MSGTSFGGQSFMESALVKIAWLKQERDKANYHYVIEVDGVSIMKRGLAQRRRYFSCGLYLFEKMILPKGF